MFSGLLLAECYIKVKLPSYTGLAISWDLYVYGCSATKLIQVRGASKLEDLNQKHIKLWCYDYLMKCTSLIAKVEKLK